MVDLQRVKKYNDALKNAKDNSNKIATEISYAKRELEKLCAELSAELGETVTVENVAEIYKRESEKIERTLSMGEEILARIVSGNGDVTLAPAVNTGIGVSAPTMSAPVASAPSMGAPVASAPNMGAPVTENNTGISGFDAFANTDVKQEPSNNGVSGTFGSLFGNL